MQLKVTQKSVCGHLPLNTCVTVCVPQAVMSSDFAISRFKHLSKLLLVHGHWCYSRLANMILYFIYKNVVRLLYLLCLTLYV